MASKAKKAKAKKVVRRAAKVAAAVLEVVSPETAARARALVERARGEPHGVTKLELRVEALELQVAELVAAKPQ